MESRSRTSSGLRYINLTLMGAASIIKSLNVSPEDDRYRISERNCVLVVQRGEESQHL